MKIRIAQLAVSKDINANLEKIVKVLENSLSDEWVLLPEGMVSGYYPEEDSFLSQLDPNAIEQSLNSIEKIVQEKKVHCLIGSVMKLDEKWYNCTIFISPDEKIIYKKNNLSVADKNHFTAGNELKLYESNQIKFGIQMCRELVFPEQWKLLKKKGAQILFHINNAIKENDKVRENLLVSRAFENQIWVCSVNNAASSQTMRSMIVDPHGKIVWQSTPQKEEIYVTEIDLLKVLSVYLEQERTDLVDLNIK